MKLFTFRNIPLVVKRSFILMFPYVFFVFFIKGGLQNAAIITPIVVTFIFIAITVHEYAHAITAQAFGKTCERIDLMVLGGQAHLSGLLRPSPKEEFWITIVGPFSNFAMALLVFPFVSYEQVGNLTAFLEGQAIQFEIIPFCLMLFFMLNVMLGAFNMIPMFPMDGGRIFRSILSGMIGFKRATQGATLLSMGLCVVVALWAITEFNVILFAIAFYIGVTSYGQFKSI